MKPVTPEQIEGHSAASIRGALEGAAVSSLVAGSGTWYLNRNWKYYRTLPISLKVLGMVIVVAPCLSIQAERRGLQYEKSQWTGVGLMAIEEQAAEERARWQTYSVKEKVGDWAARHEYSLILGSWALSMAVAGAIISKDRYQTVPQKVVQARMWAQGLTIGVLIAAGALTHTKRAEAAKIGNHDHSWAVVLEQQEIEEKQKEERRAASAVKAPTAA